MPRSGSSAFAEKLALDNNLINNGSRGEITKQLQEKFQEIISGHDKFYQSWLTFIK